MNKVLHYTHEGFESPFIMHIKMDHGYPFVAHVQHGNGSIERQAEIYSQTFADLALERHADIERARTWGEMDADELLEFVQEIADRER